MKVTEPDPVTPSPSVRRERDASRHYQDAQNLKPPPHHDDVLLAGMGDGDLTPNVRQALARLMDEVAHLRQELAHSQRHVAHLERIADQDAMIPVYNRRAFTRELGRAISLNERYEEAASLIYFDLTGFRRINEEVGYVAGDIALREVAQTLLHHVRDSDTVGRLGGDEFAVILWRTGQAEAERKARELAHAISQIRVSHNGEELGLQAAFGSTTFWRGRSAEDVIAEADQAMQTNRTDAASESGAGQEGP